MHTYIHTRIHTYIHTMIRAYIIDMYDRLLMRTFYMKFSLHKFYCLYKLWRRCQGKGNISLAMATWMTTTMASMMTTTTTTIIMEKKKNNKVALSLLHSLLVSSPSFYSQILHIILLQIVVISFGKCGLSLEIVLISLQIVESM